MNPLEIQWKFRLTLAVVVLAMTFPKGAESKFYIESCSTDDKCEAFLGYRVMADTRISNIVSMFGGGVDSLRILGANNFLVSLPDPIIQAQEIVRIPVSCACANGIRRTDSVTYSVRGEGETLSTICEGVFSGMVTPLQLLEANLNSAGEMEMNSSQELPPGQRLAVPFPCACNGGLFQGIPSAFVSYMVRRGESTFQIATMFGSSVSNVVELNSMSKGSALSTGDMLEIPVPACTSSFDPGAEDNGLMVANGTYALTAHGCVQCFCGYGYPRLYCIPAPESVNSSCSPIPTCTPALKLGQFSTTVSSDSGSCQVTSCAYKGFSRGQAITSLERRNESTCPSPPPPPTYRRYVPAQTPDASPIIEPQSIVSSQQVTPPNNNNTSSQGWAARSPRASGQQFMASTLMLFLFLYI